MIGTNAFDYIRVLDKAADASWKRETIIANNIANADTPTYKRKDIDFKTLLENEMTQGKYLGDVEKAVKGTAQELEMAQYGLGEENYLEPRVYKDYSQYSYRLDDNNVDIDTENVELASEQIRYQALTGLISQEFGHFRSVIS